MVTIYVDSNATGANDGTSERDAFVSMQDGIDAADLKRDQLWVKGGAVKVKATIDVDTVAPEETIYSSKEQRAFWRRWFTRLGK